MSEGTSLEDIEMGQIANEADNSVMNAILSDMNALDTSPDSYTYQPEPTYQSEQPMQPMQTMQSMHPMQTMQPMQSMHPMQTMQPMQSMQSMHPMQPMNSFDSMYTPVEEPEQPTYSPPPPSMKAKRKNSWSTMLESLYDPFVVTFIVGILSLPIFHTWLSKRVAWLYSVGGSLSWTGVVLQALIAGVVFWAYKQSGLV